MRLWRPFPGAHTDENTTTSVSSNGYWLVTYASATPCSVGWSPPPPPPKNWRWFDQFRFWLEPLLPVWQAPTSRPVRAQVRTCIAQMRRWKRRRWIHLLRQE